jgi:photosystem II stability/assembly factor-like uncharacterized protein
MVKMAILTGLLILLLTNSAEAGGEWWDMTNGISETDVRLVAVDPLDHDSVYAGAADKIYKSADGGETWRRIFSVYGGGVANFIAIDGQDPAMVYLATSNGLFASEDGGDTWRGLFQGIGEDEKNVTSVAIHPFDSARLYLGTAKGVMMTKDSGRNWHPFGGNLANAKANFIAIDPYRADTMYVAGIKGTFKTDDMGEQWERVLVTMPSVEISGESEDSVNEQEEVMGRGVTCIAISPHGSHEIYLGTDEGVFISTNAGKDWQKMRSTGLFDKHINYIELAGAHIYAATDEGIFLLDEERIMWKRYNKGLTARKVTMLAFDAARKTMWAAAEGGVFKTFPQHKEVAGRDNPHPSHVVAEPSVREVQDIAIQYAEVYPGKIQGWRKGAKYRSILPELSVDYDRTVTYDSGSDQYYRGPYDWGVSAKWDLADLIWNPYQKDIDVRSRLMVQLRDDVLDEVTHLYFERKRLQTELTLYPPNDAKVKLEKELRLQEVTAGIDALTGGYFSRRLNGSKHLDNEL